jgi:hypothetical protein
LGFVGHFAWRKLKDAGHAADRLPRGELLAHEKRQNKIVRGQLRFADEIADALVSSQPPRAVNQFSHGPRLSVWFCCRKLAELDAVCGSGVNGFRNAAPPND